MNLKNFKIILLLRALSLFGDILFSLGFPLLILEKTGSATQFSLSFALDLSLYMIFTLIGGYIADHYPLRKTIYRIDFILFIFMGVLALYFKHDFNIYLAYSSIVILAILRALYNMSFDKIPIAYLKGKTLNTALAYYQSMQSLSQVVALPIVGVILTYIDSIYIFWINGISFFFSGIYFYIVKPKNTHKDAFNSQDRFSFLKFKQAVSSGFTLINKNSVLKQLTILAIVMNIILSSFSANWALLYKIEYKMTDQNMSIFHAVSAAFFIISSFILSKALNNKMENYKRSIIYAQYIIISGALIIYIYPNAYGTLLGSILFSIGGALHAIPSVLIRKSIAGIKSYGSVLAAARVLSRLFSPAAMFLTVLLIQYLPIQTIFLAFSTLCLILSIIPSLKLQKA